MLEFLREMAHRTVPNFMSQIVLQTVGKRRSGYTDSEQLYFSFHRFVVCPDISLQRTRYLTR